MKIIRDYKAYLQNNPHGYWFKRKLYGWGWTPATYQGWVTILAYVIGLAFFISKLEEGMPWSEAKTEVVAPIVIITILLIFISYWKGEKPKWQWGKQLED